MSRNNTYQADLREMKFVLWEQMKFNELLSETSFYDGWDSETCNMVIDQAMKFTVNEIGPIFSATDQEGPIFDPTDGSVTLAPFFKEAYNKALEAGFQSLMVSTESGGQGAPYSLVTTVFEMISGAGPTLFMLLTAGCAAIEIIDNHGSQEQKEMWIPKLASGEWNATMVLSEPDAGSDVGNIRTKAVKQSDGSYLIKGTKIWISQGEHDANENIVHMVLARAEGAPAGTKGLSLFIVPKHRVDKSGNTTSIHNDISCIGIEHKMGIHGSPTCTLNFGENDACQGFIVGNGTEGLGIMQMFVMMNEARIMTGLIGNAQASSAYYNSVNFARQRIQGNALGSSPSAPKVPIIQHPDVRRMLMEMKARQEAGRALIQYLSLNVDKARAYKDTDPKQAKIANQRLELLTPIVKAFPTDQAWRICELAIQVHGGYGFTQDYPVEQYARNVKILSIYEGTNHIQSMDFVMRKLPAEKGMVFQGLVNDITCFVNKHKNLSILADEILCLEDSINSMLESVALTVLWSRQGSIKHIAAYANYVLEMVANVLSAWLLLDAAVVALEAQKVVAPDHPDYEFYNGKIMSARFYCHQILPIVDARRKSMTSLDISCVNISEDALYRD